MGAQQFNCFFNEPDIVKAFYKVVMQHIEWHGNSGYTGTIAEKMAWTLMDEENEVCSYAEAEALAATYLEEDDPRIRDKWGPAGAIRVQDTDLDGWYFFGWASS